VTDGNLFKADINPEELLAFLMRTGVQVADEATARSFLDGFLAGYGCVLHCLLETADGQADRSAGKVLQDMADSLQEAEAGMLTVACKLISLRIKT
jgi:hypothetical protein